MGPIFKTLHAFVPENTSEGDLPGASLKKLFKEQLQSRPLQPPPTCLHKNLLSLNTKATCQALTGHVLYTHITLNINAVQADFPDAGSLTLPVRRFRGAFLASYDSD